MVELKCFLHKALRLRIHVMLTFLDIDRLTPCGINNSSFLFFDVPSRF